MSRIEKDSKVKKAIKLAILYVKMFLQNLKYVFLVKI
jgi:DNA-binding XRE family transcriptional regulator